VSTAELDAVAAEVFARHGARSAPALVYGFPGTVLISVNDEVVHDVPGPRKPRRGDLVKLDVTVEKRAWRCGLVRNKSLSARAEARALRLARGSGAPEACAQRPSIAFPRPSRFRVDRFAGHSTGRSIHEEPQVPNYFERRQTDLLTEGLVIAIEPIISAGAGDVYEDADGWTTRDGSLAALYENTVVITNGEPILLTAAA
jgi:methionyl aminopeptidase